MGEWWRPRIGPDLQITHLKTLIAIREQGGFGAAAKSIGRTQSAVTIQMQALEEAVGVPIFATKGRNRELTEAGQTLLRYAYEIVSISNHAVSATAKSRHSGLIRIGAPQEIAEDLLPQALARFENMWPEMRVVIEVGRSPVLMQRLEDGLLDLTLSTRRSGRFQSTLLGHLPVEWIAHEDWVFEPETPLPLVLSDEPSMFRRIALSALDLSALPYVERLTSPSLAGIRLAVSAGMGVTARTRSSWFSNTCFLGERDGLPQLPNVPYYLYIAGDQNGSALSDMTKIVIEQGEKHFSAQVG
ncbi:MAG: LysR substrate-binding domain-containing protein [Pseudomonadota bacterium]